MGLWLIGLTVLLVAFVPALADDLAVLATGPGEKIQPSEMLYASLCEEAFAALDRRRERYEQIKTAEQLKAYQEQMRAFFAAQLGEFPQRTPLNAKVVAKEDRDGYRIEKIIFESQPGLFVTGVLYLPASKPPYPAVLVPCGHSKNGKAYEAYQRVSILLAKNGIAAFCYDPIGQGERYQILDAKGKPRFASTLEHTLVGAGCILLGINTAWYRVWDGMRAIDYLESRPEIDAKRIGCTGCSGGGTLTSYLMALDDRVACAAPSCYLTSFRRLLETIGPQDAEQNVHGLIAGGMDHADYILLRAPKPTLMLVATQDFFDIQGAWDTFRQANRMYTRLGWPQRVAIVEADTKHGYSRQHREAMVRWMRRWLLGMDDGIREPDFPVMTDEQMQCTPRGQVLLMKGARSVFEINAEIERTCRPRRSSNAGRSNGRGIASKRS